jgi:hypothetical protein
MPLLDTGISVTAVRNESQQGNRNYISGLNTSSLVNAYSFWSPRRAYFDSTNGYLLTFETDQSPYQIGDFRRYNHSAAAPSIGPTPNTNFSVDPGTDGVYVPAYYYNNEFNFKRADLTDGIVKVGLKYFNSLTDAQNNVNAVTLVGGGTIAYETLSFTNRIIRVDPTLGNLYPSPALTGHVVQQTTLPSSSSLLINVGSDQTNNKKFPTNGIGTTALTRYVRLDFYDNFGQIKGTIPNNIFSFTVREKSLPTLALQTQSPIPSGFTAIIVDSTPQLVPNNLQYQNNAGTAMNYGDDTLRFRFKVKGIVGSAPFPYVQGTLSMKYWDGSTETVMTGYQNVSYIKATDYVDAGNTGTWSISVTWQMPAGRTWSYDTNHTIRITYHTASV